MYNMKIKSVFLHVLFFITISFVFLFVLFPGKKIAEYFSYSLTNPDTNVSVNIENTKPAIPLGLKLKKIKLLLNQDINVVLESFKISFSPGSIFRKDNKNGTIYIQNGSVKIKNSLISYIIPEINFSNIDLEFKQLSKKKMTIECFTEGQINVELQGDIEFASSVQDAMLNLTGVILPDSPYLQKFSTMPIIKSKVKNISENGIKFNIKGVLENPKIEII